MRITLTFLASLLLASNFGAARQQTDDSCGFVVQGELTQPTVKGPDAIVPLVYVVEQPDSPLEVVSVDLEGMWLSISNEQHTEKDCSKYSIRNGATALFMVLASCCDYPRAAAQAEESERQVRHRWPPGR